MLKKTGIVVAGLLLSISVARGDNRWGVFLSYWDTSDLEATAGPGLVFSAEMVPAIQLEARLSYFSDVSDGDARFASDVEVMPLEVGLTANLVREGVLRSYAGIGAGYYRVDGEVAGSRSGIDNEWGFYGLLGGTYEIWESGAIYGATRGQLFAEAMYRVVDIDGPATETGGAESIDLDGVVVNVGLLVGW